MHPVPEHDAPVRFIYSGLYFALFEFGFVVEFSCHYPYLPFEILEIV